MAAGKQVGEFSLKTTSLTLTPGPGGSVLVQGNFEGSSAAFGTILRTATFVSVGLRAGPIVCVRRRTWRMVTASLATVRDL